jgi:hypothetical protein
MNNTTRCYPRTLQEAFPKDYCGWMERPVKRVSLYDVFLWVLSFVLYSVIGYLLLKT